LLQFLVYRNFLISLNLLCGCDLAAKTARKGKKRAPKIAHTAAHPCHPWLISPCDPPRLPDASSCILLQHKRHFDVASSAKNNRTNDPWLRSFSAWLLARIAAHQSASFPSILWCASSADAPMHHRVPPIFTIPPQPPDHWQLTTDQ